MKHDAMVEIEGPIMRAGAICETVLRDLPEWFGIEEATRSYIEQADRLPTFVARLDGEVVGFMSAEIHFPTSAELIVLGVLKAHHRQGIGRRLLAACEGWLAAQGARFVQVKTLSASHPDVNYARTRKFYEGCGYVPLEEFSDLWGAHNPCLQMIKYL